MVDIHFIRLPNYLQFGTRRKQLGYLHRVRQNQHFGEAATM
jgi:hypothetical protein